MNSTDQIISEYYSIFSPEEMEKYRSIFLDLNIEKAEKETLHKDLRERLKKLEILYIKLVKARNDIASENGFDNYFNFVMDWYEVPENKLSVFLNNSKETAKKILNNLPMKNDELPDGYWDKFNEPVMGAIVKDNTEYFLPEYVYQSLDISDDIKNRIEFKNSEYRYFFSDFDKDSKTASITFESESKSSISAISFAHELGHAITYLQLMDKGLDPNEKPDYWHETRAVEMEIKFENNLDQNVKNANRDRFLNHFILAYFEQLIYSNPDSDYADLYARSRNRHYALEENKNDMFLLNNFLINFPCYSGVYAAIYSQYV